MANIYLPDRKFITLSGAEAEHFLQNLVTTDIAKIAAGESWPGALLTPQGKIQFDFLIARDGDGFLIETHAEDAAGLVQRLTLYKLRAKVQIALAETEGVTLFEDAATAEGVFADQRFARAGMTIFRRPGKHGDEGSDDALRIAAGVAEMHRDFAPQDVFPHDVLFDTNGALSFRKGCYVGQEVVSRMQHRGTARRRLVRIDATAALPTPGTTLTAAGKPVGELGTTFKGVGMAIVRIDRVASALTTGEAIVAGGTPVTVTPYAWSGVSLDKTTGEDA
ncbi:YgfZ/GcvT domain-containing protein [Martelella endophytica]|uniref:Aminomethyltransferase n=1 Tax=Martelella endophytica TaxID=1486262 RepID=A0A0D5LW94_MAREN|nr:folate-binding protein YgfZ [Martelella endophytica]AJY48230.1 aminomethyltransferase [Martelella endophytica]